MRAYSRVVGAAGRGAWLPVCLLVVACGSDAEKAADGLLGQAPHCSESDVLKIEGTIDGAAINDTRTSNINAGFENIGMGKFYTPVATLVPLASNQLALTVNWASGLFDGQTTSVSSGTLALPASHPHPGAPFCISAGHVGFVSGGAEDGALKFAITAVKSGSDCAGPETPVDLRGCFQ